MLVASRHSAIRALVGALAALTVTLAGGACAGNADPSTDDQLTTEADPGERAVSMIEDLRNDAAPEAVAPDEDPIAFAPGYVPPGFEINRASAASPEFMSIELADDVHSLTLIWGEELRDFEETAQTDPTGEDAEVQGQPARLFSLGTTSVAVPAVLWRSPNDTPVLVVGTPGMEVDVLMDVANGVVETTPDEFILLAARLAEQRLERELDVAGG